MANYTAEDIQTLDFTTAVRTRIPMYLGSADMNGVYNGIQEIISNSIDEFYMGFGNKIVIKLSEGNKVSVRDFGRSVPFGVKADGSNVLVDIYSRPHTGGKFDSKVYNSVAGLNGIGAKATCLTSKEFLVHSYRDGICATAKFTQGHLDYYKEEATKEKNGTYVEFTPDEEVYNVEPINISFDHICETCQNLSYLTNGLSFELTSPEGKKKIYKAEHGLRNLIEDNVKKSIHPNFFHFKLTDGKEEAEVAFQWSGGKEKSYTFTNGLRQRDGGSSLTGMKTAITAFFKKRIKGEIDSDWLRYGLVYAVSCKTPEPSFTGQTKDKINNTSLRGLAQRATTQALNEFEKKYPKELETIIEYLNKIRRADEQAEKARKQVLEATKDIEKTQKRKVFASDKLKDAEFLGENSILLLVEGDSALGGMSQARDYTKYGLLALRGKILNCLSNSEEKIYKNDIIKLVLSAMNIVPGKYDSKKLRYGKLGICVDADSDGGHIALLIIALLQYFAPEFIEEGRLFWLRSPLYIVENGKNRSYYFNDEEFNKVRGSIKGEVTRAKGLGELDADIAKESMFSEKFQRFEPLVPDKDYISLLYDLMGENVEPRTKFIFENIDFKDIKE